MPSNPSDEDSGNIVELHPKVRAAALMWQRSGGGQLMPGVSNVEMLSRFLHELDTAKAAGQVLLLDLEAVGPQKPNGSGRKGLRLVSPAPGSGKSK